VRLDTGDTQRLDMHGVDMGGDAVSDYEKRSLDSSWHA